MGEPVAGESGDLVGGEGDRARPGLEAGLGAKPGDQFAVEGRGDGRVAQDEAGSEERPEEPGEAGPEEDPRGGGKAPSPGTGAAASRPDAGAAQDEQAEQRPAHERSERGQVGELKPRVFDDAPGCRAGEQSEREDAPGPAALARRDGEGERRRRDRRQQIPRRRAREEQPGNVPAPGDGGVGPREQAGQRGE